MGDHYIPQYYLRGFSDPSAPSKIWVYEKGSKRVFNPTIKATANENKRWSRDVEKSLANKVEAPAKPVLDKIRNHEKVNQSDKELLSAYMVAMTQRVDKGLERMKKIAPKVIDDVFTNVEKEIVDAIEKNPSRKVSLQNALNGLPSLKSKYEREFPIEIWYNNISPDSLPKFRAVLPSMIWVFFTSDRGQPFLSCDNPVCFDEGTGINKPESEITFPISSKVTLWATWNKSLVEYQYTPAKENIIKEINRRVVHSATKYVYYSVEADWVVNLVNNRFLPLHHMI